MVGEARVHLAYLDGGKPSSPPYWSDNEDCYTAGGDSELLRRGHVPPAFDIRDPATLQLFGGNICCVVVDMPQRKCSESWRQRVGFVVVRDAECPLEFDGQLCLRMRLRKREYQSVVFQFDHVDTFIFCLNRYQSPSLTSRTTRSNACSGASFS